MAELIKKTMAALRYDEAAGVMVLGDEDGILWFIKLEKPSEIETHTWEVWKHPEIQVTAEWFAADRMAEFVEFVKETVQLTAFLYDGGRPLVVGFSKLIKKWVRQGW